MKRLPNFRNECTCWRHNQNRLQVGFRVSLPSTRTEEDIPLGQASSMVSELAPLVCFYVGGDHDTLIIEEPEAHLHPGAQADMAVILARLVRAGVRVIVTTHSDWLLQEIGNLVLEGLLEDEMINLQVGFYQKRLVCGISKRTNRQGNPF